MYRRKYEINRALWIDHATQDSYTVNADKSESIFDKILQPIGTWVCRSSSHLRLDETKLSYRHFLSTWTAVYSVVVCSRSEISYRNSMPRLVFLFFIFFVQCFAIFRPIFITRNANAYITRINFLFKVFCYDYLAK